MDGNAGLKLKIIMSTSLLQGSLPTRECGLKLLYLPVLFTEARHSLRGRWPEDGLMTRWKVLFMGRCSCRG